MRAADKFDQETFDAYNSGLVQLSDEHMRELYSSFMLIYVEEADDAVLERLGIGEPDERCIGFAEMMTIKLGELMDQPRHVRIQAFQSQQRKREEQAEERIKSQERERETMAKWAAQTAVNDRVMSALAWLWPMLEAEKGDVSEVRRFQRKPELRLLVTTNDDMKKISPYHWRNMGCSGLRPQELRCLAVCLSKPGVPAQSDDFKKMVQAKIGATVPAEHEIVALCEPPAAMLPFRKGGPPPPPPG
eukprot:scaffold13728_cov90-Isochrysis_galbana.AAC.3